MVPLPIAHGSAGISTRCTGRRHPSLAAAREAPDEIEEKLGQLRTRLAVAENALVADISDEWTTFAAAVEDELRSWDVYLERVQATAAKAGNARERAEAAIADVRTERIAVHDRLAQARADVNGAWHEQRNHVSAARDELERKADELPAKIRAEEESEMQTIDPALVTALVATCVGR